MGFLKSLVIGMGVLIVAGLVFVAVLIGKRLNETSVTALPISLADAETFIPVSATDDAVTLWSASKKEVRIISRKNGKTLQVILLKPLSQPQ